MVHISCERHRISTAEPSAPPQPQLRQELLPGTSARCWTRAQTGEHGRGERRGQCLTTLGRHSWKLMQHVSDLLVPMLSYPL